MECLTRELLFEPDPLSDITGIQHDATNVTVGAQVRDVRLQLAPLTEPVLQPKQDLVWLPAVGDSLQQISVVGMDGADESRSENLRLGSPDHARDRLADVPTTASAEDNNKIGRGGDEAAEVRCLASSRGDQRPAEQQRREQPCNAEYGLEGDEVVDVAVVRARDRAGGVERNVRGQRGQHAQPLDRALGVEALVCCERDCRDGAVGEQCASGCDQVVNEPCLLCQLGPHDPPAGGGKHCLVVVSVDRRCGTAFE